MEKIFYSKLNMWKLDCDNDHILHKKGNVDYPIIRHTIVNPNDVDNYEEIAVADIPPYSKTEYDAKVSEFVREKYSADEEFALQRKMINTIMSPDTISAEGSTDKTLAEYQEYNTFVQECKQRAKNPDFYNEEEPDIDNDIQQ